VLHFVTWEALDNSFVSLGLAVAGNILVRQTENNRQFQIILFNYRFHKIKAAYKHPVFLIRPSRGKKYRTITHLKVFLHQRIKTTAAELSINLNQLPLNMENSWLQTHLISPLDPRLPPTDQRIALYFIHDHTFYPNSILSLTGERIGPGHIGQKNPLYYCHFYTRSVSNGFTVHSVYS